MSEGAFIIARFQPFHRGHEDLLEYTIDEYDSVTVFMAEGEDVPSARNPLTLDEREALFDAVYEDASTVSLDYIYEDDESLEHGVEPVKRALEQYHDNPDQAVCVTENPETIDALGTMYDIDSPPDTPLREKPYRGGYVREQAASGEQWRPFVGDAVTSLLDQYDFEDRIEALWE